MDPRLNKKGLKLNLGCGNKKIQGYINADNSEYCNPDILLDLENVPYPFASDSADEIRMKSVLEHMPVNPKKFFVILKEIYRICKNSAKLYIECPHPFHRWQIVDFTHQKPIHIEGLQMLDKEYCEQLVKKGSTKTPLALIYNLNFKIIDYKCTIDPNCASHIANVLGSYEEAKNESYAYLFNNIGATQKITLKAIKGQEN